MDSPSPQRGSGSPGADFETPRTKLARMLADIDDDVDNAPTPSPTKAPTNVNSGPSPSVAAMDKRASFPPKNPSSTSGTSRPPSPTGQSEARVDSDEEDSDDAVRHPQGRTARRMHGFARTSASVSPSPRSSSPPKRARRPAADESEDELYSATPLKAPNTRGDNGVSPALGSTGNGLFVSPTKSNADGDESEQELPSNPVGSKEKLAELIAQKRAERLAKEAEEKRRRKQIKKNASSAAHAPSDLPDEAVEGPEDQPNPDIERIMSDASRPARKASKKALLEMERETQRMARQQALAHQMKVKKKFTTNDLFARFNMRGPNATAADSNEEQPRSAESTASSAPNSDGVEGRPTNPVSTPPSSPPTPFDKQKALVEQGALSKFVPVRQDTIASLALADDEDEDLPDVADIFKVSRQKAPKTAEIQEMPPPAKKGLKIARLGKQPVRPASTYSDDDELEIVPPLPPHLRALERAIGATGSRSVDSKAIHHLRHLAHLNYDDSKPRQRKGARPSISHNALEARLRKQAKDQARRQHLERIEELRAKGIEIQTHEEREREAEDMEDLLEKARVEAQALRKMERKKENGDEGAMEASDDEDEDFEPDGSDEDEQGDGGARQGNDLVDEAAEESGEEEDEEFESSEDEEGVRLDDDPEHLTMAEADEHESLGAVQSRKARHSRVIADEDEDDEDEATMNQQSAVNQTPKATPSQADPFAAFGFGAANGQNALMSPTQAFNATMQTPTQNTQDDSFDILRRIAPPTGSSLPPTLPDLDSQTQVESQYNDMFVGSQVPESQRIQLNWETQAPETPLPAGMSRGASALSETPTWEPTQDQGLQSPWTIAPKLRRDDTLDSLVDPDTQSTVAMRTSESPAPSRTVPKHRGKLTRRQAPVEDSSDDEAEATLSSVRSEKRNAFREMARKRKEAMTVAERDEADKELRGMMEDQAEESEDEYAGLGGDDFVAPETEADREIIDSSAVDVDERALAAHFAEGERERNEAETSRLYKDLTTGVLRRKMGANAFDIEEDEDELAVRRRRMRQQEEAKKRKALLKDDNVKTLAEGRQSRGKDAFLKAIADDEGDDEMVGLSDDEEGTGSASATQDESHQSQVQSRSQTDAILQETSGNKRRLPEDGDNQERPPAKQRRTAPSAGLRRPTSMLEVQESLSFLLDEPQAAAMVGPTTLEQSDSEHSEQGETDHESDNDEDLIAAEEAKQNDGGFAPNPLATEAKARKDSIDMPPPPPRPQANQRRTAAPIAKAPVIDRLSLKRASSTSDSATGQGRSAWGASTSTSGFKTPSLLRRATTNSGANERGVTTGAGGKVLSRENSSGVKQGGSKKSSLAYQARVEERKAIVEAGARRREENTKRVAAMRRQGSGGGGGKGWGGAFE